ncbi:glucosamine-6-phosphate deaminase [Lacrimispora brassicae]
MEEIAKNLGATFPIHIPETVVCEDFESMSQYSAKCIADVVKEKPDALICLPAGSTAKRTFEILAEMFKKKKIDFSNAFFVALDEWLDLEDVSENCTSFMYHNFYRPLSIREDQITLFDVHAKDLEMECRRVDEYIFKKGGIDCMLLGLGMNGHLGLNEPGVDFNSYTKVISLDTVTMEVGQKYFSQDMKLTRGITLGIRHMFEAKKVVLQVGGRAKRDIVEKMYRSRPGNEIPATVLKLLPNGMVILDQDAASKINDLLD